MQYLPPAGQHPTQSVVYQLYPNNAVQHGQHQYGHHQQRQQQRTSEPIPYIHPRHYAVNPSPRQYLPHIKTTNLPQPSPRGAVPVAGRTPHTLHVSTPNTAPLNAPTAPKGMVHAALAQAALAQKHHMQRLAVARQNGHIIQHPRCNLAVVPILPAQIQPHRYFAIPEAAARLMDDRSQIRPDDRPSQPQAQPRRASTLPFARPQSAPEARIAPLHPSSYIPFQPDTFPQFRDFNGDRSAASSCVFRRMPAQFLKQEEALKVLAYVLGFTDMQHLGIPRDVVFVAHDFEAYSPAHIEEKPVTEGGVAYFDSRVTKRIPSPGQHGEHWIQEIIASHLRIEGKGHLVNRHYAKSCGHKFNFGKSQWVSPSEMKEVLASSICLPDVRGDALKPSDISNPSDDSVKSPAHHRKIILVGHAWNNDEEYMRKSINFHFDAHNTVVGIMDTQVIGARPGEEEGLRFPALKRLANNFNIKLQNPHNAGNDAVYTMIALLLLALEHVALHPKLNPILYVEPSRAGLPTRMKGPSNAGPGVDAYIARCQLLLQENPDRHFVLYTLSSALPEAQHLRCDICGRLDSHPSSSCELWEICTKCGCPGHTVPRCRGEYLENAKFGYGDIERFTNVEDRVKHEFVQRVHQLAAKAKNEEKRGAEGEDISNGKEHDDDNEELPELEPESESRSSTGSARSTDCLNTPITPLTANPFAESTGSDTPSLTEAGINAEAVGLGLRSTDVGKGRKKYLKLEIEY